MTDEISCPHCHGKISIKDKKRVPMSVKVYDDNGNLVAQTRESIPTAKVTHFSNDGGKTWVPY